MLKRLKIHRFRTVRPGTELIFNDRFNILLGRNGTGKTSLLDLISTVLRSDFSPLREEEFDIEWEIESRLGGLLSARLSNKRVRPSEGADPARPEPETWLPSCHVSVQTRDSLQNPTEIKVEGFLSQRRLGQGDWTPGRPIDLLSPGLLSRLRSQTLDLTNGTADIFWGIESDGNPAYRFDESLEVFECITERATRTRRGRSIPDPIRRKSVWASPRFIHNSSSLFDPIYTVAQPQPGQSSARVELESSRHLGRFPQQTGLQDLSMFLAVEGSQRGLDVGGPEASLRFDGVCWIFGPAEFLFTAPGGATFNHHGLSYGQKRLLAFLYYLDANPRYVVADELVNGMHHEWIRFCIEEIGERQAFLTSQNPLLLDYIPLSSAEEASKTFIQCHAEHSKDRAEFVWSNLTPEDAEELYQDHLVGIQRLGEILRVRGLW